MRIAHIAIWVSDLEMMREFYQKYFNMQCGMKYENVRKGFSSYFLSFDSGARLELMTRDDITGNKGVMGTYCGLAHFAVSVGSRDAVDSLTKRISSDGYEIPGQPRITGDGYYESIISDPEGNRVEITE